MTRRTELYSRQLAPAADSRVVQAYALAVLLALALGLARPEVGAAAAATLKPDTIAAFDNYVKLTDARNDEELRDGTHPLWIDGLPESERAQSYEMLKRG